MVLSFDKNFAFIVNQFDQVVGNSQEEKQRNLAILDKVLQKRGVVDANKAANQLTAQNQKRYDELAVLCFHFASFVECMKKGRTEIVRESKRRQRPLKDLRVGAKEKKERCLER